MTPSQHQCLIFIQRYSAAHGVSPMYAEIAAAMGLRSRAGAHSVVRDLMWLGHVALTNRHTPRSIVILKPVLDGKFFIFDNRTKTLLPVARLAA